MQDESRALKWCFQKYRALQSAVFQNREAAASQIHEHCLHCAAMETGEGCKGKKRYSKIDKATVSRGWQHTVLSELYATGFFSHIFQVFKHHCLEHTPYTQASDLTLQQWIQNNRFYFSASFPQPTNTGVWGGVTAEVCVRNQIWAKLNDSFVFLFSLFLCWLYGAQWLQQNTDTLIHSCKHRLVQ